MSRYTNITIIPFAKTNKAFPIRKSVRYPEIPLNINDLYAYTTDGDRLDLLAQQFYGNVDYWWVIASANPETLALNSLFIPVGTEIRIPYDISTAEALFNAINRI